PALWSCDRRTRSCYFRDKSRGGVTSFKPLRSDWSCAGLELLGERDCRSTQGRGRAFLCILATKPQRNSRGRGWNSRYFPGSDWTDADAIIVGNFLTMRSASQSLGLINGGHSNTGFPHGGWWAKETERPSGTNVVDLMEALKRSVEGSTPGKGKARDGRRRRESSYFNP